jgi:hypothetical protein
VEAREVGARKSHPPISRAAAQPPRERSARSKPDASVRPATGGHPTPRQERRSLCGHGYGVRCTQIVLQKSKVAGPRIFCENTKREAIADSYNLNRIAEVACEFNVRR